MVYNYILYTLYTCYTQSFGNFLNKNNFFLNNTIREMVFQKNDYSEKRTVIVILYEHNVQNVITNKYKINK